MSARNTKEYSNLIPVLFYSSRTNTQVGFDTNFKDRGFSVSDSQSYLKNQTHFQSIKKILSVLITKFEYGSSIQKKSTQNLKLLTF
jgi:hypothetical protein